MQKCILMLFVCIISSFLYSKKIQIIKVRPNTDDFGWYQINPLSKILKNDTKISYKIIVPKMNFDISQFSIAPKFPHQGYFQDLFILSISNGRVQGQRGYFFINNQFPQEMVRADRYEFVSNIPKIQKDAVQKISGRVAVIAQHGADNKFANYYHWVYEVLGRLAILEIAGIEYDWLYVGKSKKFMQETLELWGIDFNKIIEPSNNQFCIQADELIVPSLVINTNVGHNHVGNFQHPVTSQYIKNKLFTAAQNKKIDSSQFAKKIFISRKDAYNPKKILNEDDVFALFANRGFERYELTKLSVAQQIILFNKANIIASEQGSGLANILFCKPETLIIEIFQALIDNCFWWVSNINNLKYIPIATIPLDTNRFADFDNNFVYIMKSWTSAMTLPPESLNKISVILEQEKI